MNIKGLVETVLTNLCCEFVPNHMIDSVDLLWTSVHADAHIPTKAAQLPHWSSGKKSSLELDLKQIVKSTQFRWTEIDETNFWS